jgi:hypothetical protein
MGGIGIGVSPFFGVKDIPELVNYKVRVAADAGAVDEADRLRTYIFLLKSQGNYDSTKLLIGSMFGSKVRTSGIYNTILFTRFGENMRIHDLLRLVDVGHYTDITKECKRILQITSG